MKKFILILALAFATGRPTQANWFDNGEKERRIAVEQQLQEQRQINGNLGVAILILSIGCIGLLTVGAAIGSKVRRNFKKI